MKIDVCFSPVLYPVYHNPEAIVVVVDVFRATTTMAAAFSNGVSSIRPVATVEEAEAYKAKGWLVGAERNVKRCEFADFGNSPFDYTSEKVFGKDIVFTTTNGTRAITIARAAFRVITGAFINLQAVAGYCVRHKRYVSLFPLYLRGQGRISYLRIEDGRIHPFVFEIDSSLSIRSGRKDNPGSIDLFWASEQNDHRINGINPDIHHRPVRQFRSEGIQYDSFLKLIIAGRILAIAGKITPYRSQAS